MTPPAVKVLLLASQLHVGAAELLAVELAINLNRKGVSAELTGTMSSIAPIDCSEYLHEARCRFSGALALSRSSRKRITVAHVTQNA